MGIRTMLIAAIAGWAMLASTAAAKEEAEALVVCGAARCREMSGGVAKLASTLTMHPGRRPRRAAPFYDVFFVFQEAGGGRSMHGGTLRYVPSARAVRSQTASGDAIWFRAGRRLALTLIEKVDGLAPRPASVLDAPALEIGAATATAQRTLGAQPSVPASPAARVGNGGRSFELWWIPRTGGRRGTHSAVRGAASAPAVSRDLSDESITDAVAAAGYQAANA